MFAASSSVLASLWRSMMVELAAADRVVADVAAATSHSPCYSTRSCRRAGSPRRGWEDPATSVRRRISVFNRSWGLLLQVFFQSQRRASKVPSAACESVSVGCRPGCQAWLMLRCRDRSGELCRPCGAGGDGGLDSRGDQAGILTLAHRPVQQPARGDIDGHGQVQPDLVGAHEHGVATPSEVWPIGIKQTTHEVPVPRRRRQPAEEQGPPRRQKPKSASMRESWSRLS